MDVADGEDPGPARLEEERLVAVELGEVLVLDVAAGEQEPGGVGGELALEPLGVGRRRR